MRRLSTLVVSAATVVALSGACSFLPRDPACELADACDASLEEPFQSFATTDAQFGDTGSCWLSADTAKPCIAACQGFVAEQLAAFDDDGDGLANVANTPPGQAPVPDVVHQKVVDACLGLDANRL